MLSPQQQAAAFAAAVAAVNANLAAKQAQAVVGALVLKYATGAVNGINKTFTFPSAPSLVILNGSCLHSVDDYVQNGTQIILKNAINVGDSLYGY